MTQIKDIVKIWYPENQPEGDGATVRRVIGTRELRNLDPFLMLDQFNVKLPSGFPDHPHRGFETVTYLLSGSIDHEDFKGHKGKINPGDIQWMTAGKGIVHAEMPGSFDEPAFGFQLWLNLHKKDKMQDPKYQEILKEKIPSFDIDGISGKVIAGEYANVKGPIFTRTPAIYLDIRVQKEKIFSYNIPKAWNCVLFVYEGEFNIKDKQNLGQYGAVLYKQAEQDEHIQIKAIKDGKFMLMAGQPINEPIQQHGPFVMNTKEEIQQAMRDYQLQQNGFEGAHSWESKIKNNKYKQN